MANSFSQAHRLPDDIDWSVSHRTPPPVPHLQNANQYEYFPSPPNNYHIASALTTDEPRVATADEVRAAHSEDYRPPHANHQYHHQYHHHPSTGANPIAGSTGAAVGKDAIPQQQRPSHEQYNPPNQSQPYSAGKKAGSRDQSNERPATATGAAGGRRRGSFSSFLRRNSSNHAHPSAHSNSNDPPAAHTSNTAPPPLPVTRIAQAHADAAADPRNRHFRSPSQSTSHSRRKNSNDGQRNTSPNMLRKSNRVRAQQQAEQERLAREAAAAAAIPRQPPHLPSLSPLPGIATFGGEDARTDLNSSSSSHNHTDGYAYAAAPAPAPAPPRAANFSRPSAMSSGYHNNNNSNNNITSNYAVRPGYPPSSSPDVRSAGSGEYVSVDGRGESVTHRGRHSYASTTAAINAVSSPRRVRRRKDPTPFNVMVIGAKNSGKTSFISFIRHSLALPSHNKQSPNPQESPQAHENKTSFTSHYLETEIDGERVGLTLWDSKGLEQGIADLQVREMAAFVESKFEETFVEEQKVMRSPGVRDTHIHCVLLVLDPVRIDSTIAAAASSSSSSAVQNGGPSLTSLDEDLDLPAIRALWGKTTVIPVIAKADTLTTSHMSFLKRAVWKNLKAAHFDPLEALELEDDANADSDSDYSTPDESSFPNSNNDAHLLHPSNSKSKNSAHKRHSSISLNGRDDETPYIPMSILSPDPYSLPPFAPANPSRKPGRQFPWGFADPLEPEHCDFVRFRDSVFAEWRGDLRELSRARWYENWRTSRLEHLPAASAARHHPSARNNNIGPAGKNHVTQRVRGGVTPVGAVPSVGRFGIAGEGAPSSSPLTGSTSSPPLPQGQGQVRIPGGPGREEGGPPRFASSPSLTVGSGNAGRALGISGGGKSLGGPSPSPPSAAYVRGLQGQNVAGGNGVGGPVGNEGGNSGYGLAVGGSGERG